jgi:hypothetical protein
MKRRLPLLTVAALALPAMAAAQGAPGTIGACLQPQEAALATLVNGHRAGHGLPPVPVSRALSTVGQWHVWDLNGNAPATGACNMHSWSGARPDLWSAVCYTPDHAQAAGMWNKPREITGNVYSGAGYELSAGGSGGISAAQALSLWQGSPGHNTVILNQGSWAGRTWRAMGVGLAGGYAVLWFGEQADPLGAIAPCGADPIFAHGFQP